MLVGRASKDVDIVVEGDGLKVAEAIALRLGKGTEAKYYGQFGTAMIRYGEFVVEFVGARKESYQISSRKPTVSAGSLEDDQKRRDFTINALAISLNTQDYGTLIDPSTDLKTCRTSEYVHL